MWKMSLEVGRGWTQENQLGSNCHSFPPLPPQKKKSCWGPERGVAVRKKSQVPADWGSDCEVTQQTSEALILGGLMPAVNWERSGERGFALVEWEVKILIRQLEIWDWRAEEISRLELWIWVLPVCLDAIGMDETSCREQTHRDERSLWNMITKGTGKEISLWRRRKNSGHENKGRGRTGTWNHGNQGQFLLKDRGGVNARGCYN